MKRNNATLRATAYFLRSFLGLVSPLRIPVNVTADSGNVTGVPANVTEGRCCAF
jgi:hypothetical protein